MLDACVWDHPGANRYTGTVAEAVARYDFPKEVAEILVSKVKRIQTDAVVTIKRDSIEAPFGYAADLADMHFGRSKHCKGPVRRDGWPEGHSEVALVYCHLHYCIAIPQVCGNVSRIYYERRSRVPSLLTPEPAPLRAEIPVEKVHTIPEPGSLALAGLGLLTIGGLNSLRNRRRQRTGPAV